MTSQSQSIMLPNYALLLVVVAEVDAAEFWCGFCDILRCYAYIIACFYARVCNNGIYHRMFVM